MKRLIVAALLACVPLGAQAVAPKTRPAPPSPPSSGPERTRATTVDQRKGLECISRELRTRVFPIHYWSVAEAVNVINPLLGPCGAYQAPKSLKLLTVTDEPARLDAVTRALANWDLPPQPVQVTVRLILATQDEGPANAPTEVGALSDSLARVTRFTHFVRLGMGTSRAEPGAPTQIEVGEKHFVRFVAAVDAAHGVVRLAPFEVFEREKGTAGHPPPAPRLLFPLAEVNLPVGGPENLVGATGRGGERALFLALTAARGDAPAPAPTKGN